MENVIVISILLLIDKNHKLRLFIEMFIVSLAPMSDGGVLFKTSCNFEYIFIMGGPCEEQIPVLALPLLLLKGVIHLEVKTHGFILPTSLSAPNQLEL